MERIAAAELPAPEEAIFARVADLTTYPEWMDLVARVEPADATEGDPGPAHFVDLRARMGPLQRIKRLRMVRSIHEPNERARFERREVDGRQHATWQLDATVDGSELTMRLFYGGSLWGRALDLVLGEKIDSGITRLSEILATDG